MQMFSAFRDLNLPFSSLTAHHLVVGQSGSGKSYFLGVMIEEIGLRTSARVVVLDRAGDFLKVQVPRPPRQGEAFTEEEELLRRNLAGIGTVHSRHLHLRSLLAASGNTHPSVRGLGMSPEWLSLSDLSLVVGLEASPGSWTKLDDARIRALGRFRSIEQIAEGLREGGHLPEHAQVVAAASELLEGLMDEANGNGQGDDGWSDTPKAVVMNSGVHVVDLTCLQHEHARQAVILAVLRALWSDAREQWSARNLHGTQRMQATRTASSGTQRFERIPTFIVIDEAHHLCSADKPENPLALLVREIILEIATEGRKYGLWLVVGTQRPTRLHSSLLSEASNLLLMRTTTSVDLRYLAELYPSIAAEIEELPDLERGKGLGMIVGEWAHCNGQPAGVLKVNVRARLSTDLDGRFPTEEWVHP